MKLKKFKFKKVKSTNYTAIRIIKETKYNLGMVVAETQVNGRGQYGRKWISSKGNLFISFFNELNKKKLSINTITKINCLLVKKSLSSFTKKKILFKKPNDLLINKKKNLWDFTRNHICKRQKIFNYRYRCKYQKKSNYKKLSYYKLARGY